MAFHADIRPALATSVAVEHWIDLSEEQASGGHKTGRMRWVLLISLAMAVAGLFGIAYLAG